MSDLKAMRQKAFTWFKVAIRNINSSETYKQAFDDCYYPTKVFIDEYSDPRSEFLYIEWIDIVDALGDDFDVSLGYIADCLYDILEIIYGYGNISIEKWLKPIYDYAEVLEQE